MAKDFSDDIWIREKLLGLPEMSLEHPFMAEEIRTLKANMDVIMAFHDKNEKQFLEGIAAKTEEIKGLRDAVSKRNQTSPFFPCQPP